MSTRRRRPPRRDGTGRHRAAATPWEIAGRIVVYTAVLTMLGSGVYVYAVQEKALHDGYKPAITFPRVAPEMPSAPLTLPKPIPLPDVAVLAGVPPPEPTPSVVEPPIPLSAKEARKSQPPGPPTAASCITSKMEMMPRVQTVGCFLDEQFPEIGGLEGRQPNELDVVVGRRTETGNRVAACAMANFENWNIASMAWKRVIVMSADGAPRPPKNVGTDDRLRISFKRAPSRLSSAELEC